jgi:Secretion system C-terminal sorting domain
MVYPNPVKNAATLEYNLIRNENISIRLCDMQGRFIKAFMAAGHRSASNHKERLNFGSDVETGNYILTIENGNKTFAVKVIKE